MAWRVTYEITTPESAEDGDAEERGFIGVAYGVQWPIAKAMAAPDSNFAFPSLREALGHCTPGEDGGNGRDLYESDGRRNFTTGATERRALHAPPGITAASFGRVKRLLDIR